MLKGAEFTTQDVLLERLNSWDGRSQIITTDQDLDLGISLLREREKVVGLNKIGLTDELSRYIVENRKGTVFADMIRGVVNEDNRIERSIISGVVSQIDRVQFERERKNGQKSSDPPYGPNNVLNEAFNVLVEDNAQGNTSKIVGPTDAEDKIKRFNQIEEGLGSLDTLLDRANPRLALKYLSVKGFCTDPQEESWKNARRIQSLERQFNRILQITEEQKIAPSIILDDLNDLFANYPRNITAETKEAIFTALTQSSDIMGYTATGDPKYEEISNLMLKSLEQRYKLPSERDDSSIFPNFDGMTEDERQWLHDKYKALIDGGQPTNYLREAEYFLTSNIGNPSDVLYVMQNPALLQDILKDNTIKGNLFYIVERPTTVTKPRYNALAWAALTSFEDRQEGFELIKKEIENLSREQQGKEQDESEAIHFEWVKRSFLASVSQQITETEKKLLGLERIIAVQQADLSTNLPTTQEVSTLQRELTFLYEYLVNCANQDEDKVLKESSREKLRTDIYAPYKPPYNIRTSNEIMRVELPDTVYDYYTDLLTDTISDQIQGKGIQEVRDLRLLLHPTVSQAVYPIRSLHAKGSVDQYLRQIQRLQDSSIKFRLGSGIAQQLLTRGLNSGEINPERKPLMLLCLADERYSDMAYQSLVKENKNGDGLQWLTDDLVVKFSGNNEYDPIQKLDDQQKFLISEKLLLLAKETNSINLLSENTARYIRDLPNQMKAELIWGDGGLINWDTEKIPSWIITAIFSDMLEPNSAHPEDTLSILKGMADKLGKSEDWKNLLRTSVVYFDNLENKELLVQALRKEIEFTEISSVISEQRRILLDKMLSQISNDLWNYHVDDTRLGELAEDYRKWPDVAIAIAEKADRNDRFIEQVLLSPQNEHNAFRSLLSRSMQAEKNLISTLGVEDNNEILLQNTFLLLEPDSEAETRFLRQISSINLDARLIIAQELNTKRGMIIKRLKGYYTNSLQRSQSIGDRMLDEPPSPVDLFGAFIETILADEEEVVEERKQDTLGDLEEPSLPDEDLIDIPSLDPFNEVYRQFLLSRINEVNWVFNKKISKLETE
ncbi:MAG: hypothetical protein US52_C0045G0006 [candidate division WS6 bacterium GW2011_GWA2_37_6]|uniref:Uncharacterized protein n=1 Tax=candidate division WS6 bacterium GW2011_GWA2_37_6 TaxID=1619087 RepID=A0A0G0K2G4_9BACT|nr:MAG: hypothetical protein US52_C0045G0006 [candidate division WS6 bacterium GW2011_GWA2_37_6]